MKTKKSDDRFVKNVLSITLLQASFLFQISVQFFSIFLLIRRFTNGCYLKKKNDHESVRLAT